MIPKPKTSKSLLRGYKPAKWKPVRKPKRQVTCTCDIWWFPHRYVFGKCPPDLWDSIALSLGAKTKEKGKGKKPPF